MRKISLHRGLLYAMLLAMPVAVGSWAFNGSSGQKKSQHASGGKPSEMKYKAENTFMNEAIQEARVGIYACHGGPFGSVIVKDGQIISRGHNQVVAKNDPTCHGEMEAIRKACATLKTYDLSDCELYPRENPALCVCAPVCGRISKRCITAVALPTTPPSASGMVDSMR